MSTLTNNQVSLNTSILNKTNLSSKKKKKAINNQEIISLQKLLKSEILEAKGQELVNTYIRLVERQYETLIEQSINKNELIKAHQNNRIFQKVLDKTNNKIIQRNNKTKSKKETSNSTRSFSITNNKISTKSSSLNLSPIKKNKSKKNEVPEQEQVQEDQNQSTYWKDYDFLKPPEQTRNSIIKINKNIIRNNSVKRKMSNNSSNPKDNSIFNRIKQLENYYIYLLNRRQKMYERKETDEEQQQEKMEVEILRQILEEIYKDDEKLKKNLEDETLPEFYKRFIIQNEIKKDNIFIKKFRFNYNESQKLKGPQMSYGSKLICKNIINYEPIYKRIDKIMLKRKNNLEKLKRLSNENKNINKNNKNKISRNLTKKNNINSKYWLKSMDDWYKRKNEKIKERREKLEKNDPNNKECVFKPLINHNAKIKVEDEGLLCSDRLYLEYFTLREKKMQMIEKEQNNFTFQPNVTYRKDNDNSFD